MSALDDARQEYERTRARLQRHTPALRMMSADEVVAYEREAIAERLLRLAVRQQERAQRRAPAPTRGEPNPYRNVPHHELRAIRDVLNEKVRSEHARIHDPSHTDVVDWETTMLRIDMLSVLVRRIEATA